MAVLPPTQFPIRHMSGDTDRWAVFSLLNINAGDTVDLGEFFSVVKRGTLIGTTLAAAALVSGVNGTVITIPAGPSADGGILTVFGVAR